MASRSLCSFPVRHPGPPGSQGGALKAHTELSSSLARHVNDRRDEQARRQRAQALALRPTKRAPPCRRAAAECRYSLSLAPRPRPAPRPVLPERRPSTHNETNGEELVVRNLRSTAKCLHADQREETVRRPVQPKHFARSRCGLPLRRSERVHYGHLYKVSATNDSIRTRVRRLRSSSV